MGETPACPPRMPGRKRGGVGALPRLEEATEDGGSLVTVDRVLPIVSMEGRERGRPLQVLLAVYTERPLHPVPGDVLARMGASGGSGAGSRGVGEGLVEGRARRIHSALEGR